MTIVSVARGVSPPARALAGTCCRCLPGVEAKQADNLLVSFRDVLVDLVMPFWRLAWLSGGGLGALSGMLVLSPLVLALQSNVQSV